MGKNRTTIVKSPADLKVYARSGIVHGSKTWTSTQVHSSGGGGYIGPQGGHVKAANVTSSNTTHNTFFLVDDDGKEIEVNLTDVSFGVRDGHHVTAVYAGHQNDQWWWLAHLHNHNTDKSAKVSSSYDKVCGNPNVLILIAVHVLAIALGIMAQSWLLFLVVFAAYWGYTFFVESPKLGAMRKELDRRARELIADDAAKVRARGD
mgnify:CR=1 FL=1